MEKTGHAQFGLKELREKDLDRDPFRQFEKWYEEAAAGSGLRYPDAFALATVSPDLKPSIRMLLLKGLDERGFVFYTNSESRKGDELSGNPNAAMCFWWERVERQVRIEAASRCCPEATPTPISLRVPEGASSGRGLQSRAELSRAGNISKKGTGARSRVRSSEVPRPPY